MIDTFGSRAEIQQRSVGAPRQFSRNHVQMFCQSYRLLAAGTGGQPDLRMLALGRASDEGDALTIRRPAWTVVRLVVIGNARQRPTVAGDHPHVSIAAVLQHLPTA